MRLPDPEGEKIDNLEKRVNELEARLSDIERKERMKIFNDDDRTERGVRAHRRPGQDVCLRRNALR